MKNKFRLLIILLFCLTIILFSFSGCRIIKAANEFKQLRNEAEENANRLYAAIITVAFNANNALADEENKLEQLPNSIDEFNEWATETPVSMEEEDYTNALPYIEIDDEGEAYVIED